MAKVSRTGWAPWLLDHTSRRPSSHHTAQERGSIGAAATRWLTMRCSTTTSQSSKSATKSPAGISMASGEAMPGKTVLPWSWACLGVDDRVEGVEVGEDLLGRVHGLGLGLGHDGGHGLAHEADDVAGQDRSLHLHVEEAQLGVEVGQVEVGRRHDGQHAGQLEGVGDLDGLDAGVGDGGADEGDVHGAGRHRHVVDVLAGAGEEARVLDALDPVAEDRHGATQSELGRGLASLSGRATPPTESEPSPGFVQSSSNPEPSCT